MPNSSLLTIITANYCRMNVNVTTIQNTTEPNASVSHITVHVQSGIHPRHLFVIAAYCVIMLVSVVGNSLVLAVVYRNENKRMRTISNYFIVNMSCSDLLITVCSIPIAITGLTVDKYIPLGGTLGDVFCKLGALLLGLSIEVSLLSLAVITVDRFLLVFFPHKRFITSKRALILIGTIWLTGSIFIVPLAVQTTLHESRDFKGCILSLPRNVVRAYFITCLVVFLVLPLTTMVIMYSSIVVRLFGQRTPGANSAVNQEHSNKRNRKVLSMLVTIVTFVIVCWMPIWPVYIDCIITSATTACDSLMYLQVLAFANCALNPCAYVIFNENFRVAFYRILRAVFCPSWLGIGCCQNQVFPNNFVFSRRISPAYRS